MRNHRLPISTFEYSQDGGSSWISVPRQDHNYFMESSGFGSSPVQVRLTASNGATIIDEMPVAQSSLEVQGSTQF